MKKQTKKVSPYSIATLYDTDYRDDLGSWQKLMDSLGLNYSTRKVRLGVLDYSDNLNEWCSKDD